ncbi:hypothetical protein [Pseudomonas viridiflava]|uniref:hypothetical protein n=1 Tax=Pseudomonas viridiflava TaxID=33069 RepID=UPI0013D2AD90|nr:hypothetical protein [Pseudomonas viridiflava]MEE4160531.1 hypothetical protein [Pseudomonas viridiflava]
MIDSLKPEDKGGAKAQNVMRLAGHFNVNDPDLPAIHTVPVSVNKMHAEVQSVAVPRTPA